jgi:hypothetical protein
MDLNHTILWCVQNNIVVTFSVVEGVLCVDASNDNISSTYPLPDKFGPEELGESLLLALHGVEHGTQFHQSMGMFPPITPMSPEKIAHKQRKAEGN